MNRSLATLKKPPRTTPRRPAYILVLVLLLLIVAAVVLVQIANRALHENARTLASARDLQSRWGRISCQRVILPSAAELFTALASGQTQAKQANRARYSTLRESLELGGQSFEFILADECAKLNLNAVVLVAGDAKFQSAMRGLLPPQVYLCMRPAEAGQPRGQADSWGEIFDLKMLSDNAGGSRALAEASREITLWGSGRLNVHMASDSVLEWLCKSVVTDGLARRIVQRRNESQLSAQLLVQQTVLNQDDAERLGMLLSDGSTTYSLWSETFDGNRRFQHVLLSTLDDTGVPTVQGFSLD